MRTTWLANNRQAVNNAFALLVLAAFIWGIQAFNAPPDVPQIGIPEVLAQRSSGSVPIIVDVRGPKSYEEGHIEGAQHIPLGELEARIKELPADKAQRVVVYCGNGSDLGPRGTAKLRSMGFTNVANLSGGIEEWRASGQKIVMGKS
jgi:rhodanese-related sulfurtransferase